MSFWDCVLDRRWCERCGERMKRTYYDRSWVCVPCEDEKETQAALALEKAKLEAEAASALEGMEEEAAFHERKLVREAAEPDEWDVAAYTRRIMELRRALEIVAKETESGAFLSVGTIAIVRRTLKRGSRLE